MLIRLGGASRRTLPGHPAKAAPTREVKSFFTLHCQSGVAAPSATGSASVVTSSHPSFEPPVSRLEADSLQPASVLLIRVCLADGSDFQSLERKISSDRFIELFGRSTCVSLDACLKQKYTADGFYPESAQNISKLCGNIQRGSSVTNNTLHNASWSHEARVTHGFLRIRGRWSV